MTRFWLALLLTLPPQDRPAETSVVVGLKDGSRFAARVLSDVLVVQTQYGEQKIPIKDLSGLRLAGEGEFTVRTARVSIQGKLIVPEFTFETSIGRLRVPTTELKSLDVGGNGAYFTDSKTIGLWTFDEVGRQSAMKLEGAEIVRDESGTMVLNRTSEDGFAAVDLGEDFKLGGADFTVEARVKVGSTTKQYVSVFSVNDAANPTRRDLAILVFVGGQLWAGTQNMGVNTPSAVINLKEWVYLAVTFEPKNQLVTFYVKGKQVHQQKAAFSVPDNRQRLYIGHSPERSDFGAPERVQFVRISRGVRTTEEIVEWQKALESGEVVALRGDKKGISMRDGGFVCADFPRLAGTKFRTRFGELTLKDRTSGQLSIYSFREKDLAGLQDEVRELIGRLGSEKIEEREKAHSRILKIGAPAIPLLKDHIKDSDEEVTSQVADILKRFSESGEDRQPIGDVLRMGQTVLLGWVDVEKVEVATPYGTLDVPIGGIQSLSLGRPSNRPARFMRLRSGEIIEGEAPKESAIEIETEFGVLTIPMADVLALSNDATAKAWTVKTAKMSVTGKVEIEKITLETPVGPIAIPLPEITEYGDTGKGGKP